MVLRSFVRVWMGLLNFLILGKERSPLILCPRAFRDSMWPIVEGPMLFPQQIADYSNRDVDS